MPELRLPRLSETMEEGTIVAWLVADGADIRRGDPVAEIETDKASVAYESDADGIIQILVPAGETVTVGTAIANLHGPDAHALQDIGPGSRVLGEDAQLAGTVESPTQEVTRLSLTRMQAVVARRMTEASTTIPAFPVGIDADVEVLLAWRSRCKARDRSVPSFNDFVVKAAAIALSEQPRANGGFRDGHIELRTRVNVGIAVAIEAGLVVPTIFDADRKPVAAIAAEARALASRAREGSITPAELSGATFTVSNLGMFGVHRFTPIITPGQAAVLGVGAAQVRWAPTASGDPIMRRVCELTLVADHRILYGADAARFTTRIAELLARPDALL